MPANGEKRQRWLIICKYGAMVEASGGSGPNSLFHRRFVQNFGDRGKTATVFGRIQARCHLACSCSAQDLR